MKLAGIWRSEGGQAHCRREDIVLRPGDSPKQVSLADEHGLCEARKAGGVCGGRFKADLTTRGLDYHGLEPGDRLTIGRIVIEVTAVGKGCFAECDLYRAGRICPLPGNVAFGRVLRGGEAHVGDFIGITRRERRYGAARAEGVSGTL